MVFSLPRPSLVDKGRISCDSAVLPRPGHKDDVVAKALAEQLSKALDVAVCVVAGIHTESALPSELETIVENCSEAGSQVILAIQSAQFDLVRQGG
jgi:hypothetical protein